MGRTAARRTRERDLDRERERMAPLLESLIDQVVAEAKGEGLDDTAHFSELERCAAEFEERVTRR